MPRPRRLRGLMLRLVLHRTRAVAAGAALALPGVVLMVGDFAWETGISDGLALLAVATGAALAWAGASGRRPDWDE